MGFANAFGVGSSIGSVFSPALYSGLGIISANHQSGKAFGRQLYAMQEQARLNYEYAQKSAENSPSWNRKGLESAGYNPMLAVQNATSGVNSSWTSPNSAPNDQATDAMTNGVSNATDLARVRNESILAQSQDDKNYAEADKAKTEKQALVQKMPYISKREKAEIANVEKDTLAKEAQIHNLEETTRFIEKNYELQRELGYLQSMTGIDIAHIGSNAAKYSANKNYAATKYASDKNFQGGLVGTGLMLGAGALGWLVSKGLIRKPKVGFRTD